MLSDDSSSDSETGRFKGKSDSKETHQESSTKKDAQFSRSMGHSRPSENSRFQREFERKRSERDPYDRHDDRNRDRNRFSRRSPIRIHSGERNREYSRRSNERHRSSREARHRSNSRERKRSPLPKSLRSPERRKDIHEEKYSRHSKKEESKKPRSRSRSAENKIKRSIVQKPVEPVKPKTECPIEIDDHSEEEVQPGSYYKMIPAASRDKSQEKEKSEESSEIDSSDDERLRAKLLNLEKKLNKTKKKKHKKKHKKHKSKSSKDKDSEVTAVEVTSTTDIQEGTTTHDAEGDKSPDVVEVSSTQKTVAKDSSEEGEISSDDNTQDSADIDPSDLRHRLKRPIPKGETDDLRQQLKTKPDVCGPALPPHLESRFRNTELEGPSLPPKSQKAPKNIGPAIPDEMRKVLADSEVKYVSSEEEDDAIGPLPVGAQEKWTEAHQKLEERALDIKIKKMDGQGIQSTDVKSREKWMLELPEGKAKILGLEARSFRAKEGPDMSDRSSWTDTPEEKARKAAGLATKEDPKVSLEEEARSRLIHKRDEEQEKAIKKHKKKHKRDESLLEIHEKKIKKKKKKDEKEHGPPERRPFSRDVDLQVNRFDEAQKRNVIKKAHELDSRFSRGEAKYL